MKKLLLLLLIFTSGNIASAQKNFEGKIIYNFVETGGKKNATLEAFFGKQKIKAILKDSDTTRNGKDDLLIDFTTGVVHHFNSRRKTYRTDSLRNAGAGMMPGISLAKEKNKIILNYPSTAYAGQDTAKSDFMGPMSFIIWYADSLYFPFDKVYANTDMVPMFGNGSNISMGMEMNMGKGEYQTSFQITPVSIEPQILPEAVFMMPADYTLKEYQSPATDTTSTTMTDSMLNVMKDSAAIIVDRVMTMVDSTVNAPPDASGGKKTAQKTASKKSSRRNTKKQQPQKNSATKPKE